MSLVGNIGVGAPGRIQVSGGPLRPLLLDTPDATAIGFYDRFGDLHTIAYRVFTDDMWALATRQDEDWHATLVRLGIQDAGTIEIPRLPGLSVPVLQHA